VSELPIALSTLSLGVAAFALGWNVYRDVLLKARLRVGIATMGMFSGSEHQGWVLQLNGVNFGPGILTVASVYGRQTSPWWRFPRKTELFYVMPGPYAQYSNKLPSQLGVGEQVTLMLSPDLYAQPWTSIGLQDTFGRTHWVPRSRFRSARRRYLEQHVTPQGSDASG